jgi:diadenosine tetraphosphatase ApaH/serine/threonine PP2A family protein phosphatase
VRIGIVSDIHGNLPALETVMHDMGAVDRLLCLGDFVGYGPWPNECVDLLRERGVISIAGNHDLAAIGTLSTEDFNPEAAFAAAWTADKLRVDTRQYLESLEPLAEVDGITLAHGSPREPVWEYLLSLESAAESFGKFSTPSCLVGHSHIPCLFLLHPTQGVAGTYAEPGSQVVLSSERFIANPGSVGQPRDRDPRASYAIYDIDHSTFEWRRVEYDIAATQQQILSAGLPRHLADRLARGV